MDDVCTHDVHEYDYVAGLNKNITGEVKLI